MSEKFTKDIENSGKVLNLDDDKDYTDPFNKDDRIWINMYFIETQLKTMKWALIIIAVILFYYVFIR